MNRKTFLLLMTLVVAGCLQTVMQTFQLARRATGVDQVETYLKHPYLQNLFADTGLVICLLVHLLQQVVMKERAAVREEEIPVNIFILLPPALIELAGGILNYAGLAFMRGDAGTYQMLSASLMIWCGLLSIPVFRRNLSWFQWLGMLVIAGGLFVKASIMFPSIFPSQRSM